MKEKLTKLISSKFDLGESQKEKIRNFRATRLRMINMMVKNGEISKFRLALINNFLTFLGCGKVKNAPGTFASFMTVLVWLGATMFFTKIQLSAIYENIFWASFIIIATFYSIILIPIYTRNFNEDDHPSIVMDEVVGQLIALTLTYPLVRQYYQEETWLLTKIIMFTHMFLCFLLFRALDIAKPSIIGSIDRNMKNPFGVMLDDIAAGIIAAILNIILFLFYKHSILDLHGYNITL